jgi:hypothetical protein
MDNHSSSCILHDTSVDWKESEHFIYDSNYKMLDNIISIIVDNINNISSNKDIIYITNVCFMGCCDISAKANFEQSFEAIFKYLKAQKSLLRKEPGNMQYFDVMHGTQYKTDLVKIEWVYDDC